MAAREVILSIDGGTESVRVGLVDARGRLVASAAEPYPTRFPRGGWAEQAPADWWASLCAAARACLAAAAPGCRVVGLCADATTCTLVPLDGAGEPLRPALLWMDVRAAAQARAVAATGHAALARYTPAGVSAEWMLPKALWLAAEEPETWVATASLVEYLDWLNLRLTGRLALNLNTATQRWLYNARAWHWPLDLFEAVGLRGLAARLPADVVPAGERLGALTPAAARDLGLAAGTPVVQGGGDAFVAVPGLGLVEVGGMGLIVGSSTVLAGLTAAPATGPGFFGSFPDAIVPGLELVEAGQASSGSILAWFRRELARELPADRAYRTLDAEAAAEPPGSGGVVVLENFQGNRTPYTDSRVRGAVWGLSLATSRAQIWRALMEGIGYGTRGILAALSAAGVRPPRLVACGGATKSALFMQILADSCGLPIALTEVGEAPLLGCAVLAAAGLGLHTDLHAAAAAMVRVTRTYEPRPETAEIYAAGARLYEQSFHGLRGPMHAAQPAQAQPAR
jgi:ribulokinase